MKSGFEPIAVLGINWLIPGAGFMIKGRLWHGIVLFLLLNATFVIGLMLYGSVIWPNLDRASGSFNLVNVLTFLGQMGNGGMSLFCLMHEKLGLEIYNYQAHHPFSDLAALYFLTSGAMNYFSTCNLWDRYYKTSPAKGAGGN